jgi:glycine cleavage system transcriptional repressor
VKKIMMVKHYLVISALGSDRSGIVDQLTQPIHELKGNIVDSRMTTLGGEFAILMLVEGEKECIDRLEQRLPQQETVTGLTIHLKRTQHLPASEPMLAYAVSVVSLDNPGIVNQLAAFFSSRQVNIHSLETDSYHAPHTGTPMFGASMVVHIPATTKISQLRTEFIEFCDNLNLDAELEPYQS